MLYIFRYITFHVNGTFENHIASRNNIKSYEQGSETLNPNIIYVGLEFLHCGVYMYVSFQVPVGMHFRIYMK
jgi:hypothetical protein